LNQTSAAPLDMLNCSLKCHPIRHVKNHRVVIRRAIILASVIICHQSSTM